MVNGHPQSLTKNIQSGCGIRPTELHPPDAALCALPDDFVREALAERGRPSRARPAEERDTPRQRTRSTYSGTQVAP
jgi:hypothetical protein